MRVFGSLPKSQNELCLTHRHTGEYGDSMVAAFAPAPSGVDVIPTTMQGAAAAEQALSCLPAGVACPCFAKAFHHAWVAKGWEHPSKIVDKIS